MSSGQELCQLHKEPILKYCLVCKVGVCGVCEEVRHSGHEKRTLHAVTLEQYRGVKQLEQTATKVKSDLDSLLTEVRPNEQRMHRYVESELDDLLGAIEEKRRSLLQETDNRAEEMYAIIEKEVEECEKELAAITEGQAVLDKMASKEGTMSTKLGQLIHGRLSYDDFIKEVDVPLHEPPRMLHLLGLQLPTQSLQEVCEWMTWTPLSVAAAPQIFPVEETSAE